MHIHAFMEDARLAPGARRFAKRSFAALAMLILSLPTLADAASAQALAQNLAPAPSLEQARAQLPGAVAKAPLSDRLKESVLESVRSQLLDGSSADVRILVHFPLQRGENGRVCGEVIEAGSKPRTFFTIYTRAGRALTRVEDETFEAYIAADTVFRNCSPRL